jgi:hypothetical protein
MPSQMKAVYSQALSEYFDLIIFSVRGKHSPASDLGGGGTLHDFPSRICFDAFFAKITMEVCITPCDNGSRVGLTTIIIDDGVVTMEKRVTLAFENAKVISPPSTFVDENFEKDPIKVRSLLYDDKVHLFQGHLLSGLLDNRIGLYSYFHDVSTYKNGYGHPETLRLGWM